LCTNAQKRGWSVCPSPSIPAGEIEQFVVEEIRAIGRDAEIEGAPSAALRECAGAWDTTAPHEQAGLLQRFVIRVIYGRQAGNIDITFHQDEIPSMATEALNHEQVKV
jgi:hypothetical protein